VWWTSAETMAVTVVRWRRMTWRFWRMVGQTRNVASLRRVVVTLTDETSGFLPGKLGVGALSLRLLVVLRAEKPQERLLLVGTGEVLLREVRQLLEGELVVILAPRVGRPVLEALVRVGKGARDGAQAVGGGNDLLPLGDDGF